ncbi:hypothetical protein SAMN05443633_101277 [Chryseobacterium arachidis]|uniref:Uncharacterized protein n=1 Tax=Chryseobacterium arachidis TaxID=1416778 RepID=A0A1M4TN18_9FLAO|nr:hypothetical protein [Chryseobacterium arachidis]SHE45785.1 hypothetical protein SAMN05443633_101277 [Chryseobacterium arachidis]
MNPFRDYQTDFLAYLFFMDKTHYSGDSYSQMKMELADRDFNFDNFNQELYIRLVIKDVFAGWEKQVRKMFSELIANGWTFTQTLDYKYSWGRLTFRGFHTEVNPKFHEILEKYIIIFESTCGVCGNRRNVESYGDYYFCKKCYLKYLKKFRISNIDKKGFLYFDEKKHYIFWSDINNIEWENNNYDAFRITLNKLSSEEQMIKEYDETDHIFFSNENFNFFKLLRKIPAQLLTEIQKEEISEICNSLEKCIICGRKSVIKDRCQICGNLKNTFEYLTENSLRRFGSRQEMIEHKKKSFKQSLKNITMFRYRYKTDMSFK